MTIVFFYDRLVEETGRSFVQGVKDGLGDIVKEAMPGAVASVDAVNLMVKGVNIEISGKEEASKGMLFCDEFDIR